MKKISPNFIQAMKKLNKCRHPSTHFDGTMFICDTCRQPCGKPVDVDKMRVPEMGDEQAVRQVYPNAEIRNMSATTESWQVVRPKPGSWRLEGLGDPQPYADKAWADARSRLLKSEAAPSLNEDCPRCKAPIHACLCPFPLPKSEAAPDQTLEQKITTCGLFRSDGTYCPNRVDRNDEACDWCCDGIVHDEPVESSPLPQQTTADGVSWKAHHHLMKRMFDECGLVKAEEFIQRVESGEHDVPSPWPAKPVEAEEVAEEKTTLLGHTKREWIGHIDNLFQIAIPGEDIPEAALLYGWHGVLTDEDRSWAKVKITEILKAHDE
jgi:hypothetical protein